MTAWTLLSLLLGRLLILERHLCNLELSPCWGFKWPSRPPLPPGMSDPFTPYILRTAAQHCILVQSLCCLCWYSTFTKTSLLPIYFTLLLCTILHLTDIWGGSSQCTALHIRYCNITQCNAIMQGLTSEEATSQYNTKDSPLRRPRAWPCHPEFQPLHVFPLSSYLFLIILNASLSSSFRATYTWCSFGGK